VPLPEAGGRVNMHEPRWSFQRPEGKLHVYECTRCGKTVKVKPDEPLPGAWHED
jgi:hypothetical protein